MSGSRFWLVILIIYGAYVIKNFIDKKKNMDNTIHINPESVLNKFMGNTKKFIIVIAAIVIVVVFLINSIIVVDAGFTGVYSIFGKVKNNEVSSGIHLVNPFAKITPMTIRTEEYTMSIMTGEGKKYGADAITALTKEGLSVDLDITVLYHLKEQEASNIYKNVGLDYEEKIIRPEIRSAIREVIAQYEVKDIYSEKRQEAAQKILSDLSAKLDIRGIAVEDVLLRNVQLPANLANAIQEKLQAEQEAEKYDFILDRERKEKERKIIEAEGQEESQRIINKSLTTNYLYYSYINNLKDREGPIYVPTSPTTGVPLFRDLGR
jgi:regulator of protease activity HflC (stomatin/prohibitin superfamily)